MTLVKTTPKKPSSTHRKRVAAHHRHSRSYVKAYWPYLPIAAIVTLGVIANGFIGTLHRRVLSYATSVSSQGLLDGTNQERAAGGLPALRINAQLSQAAQAKAADMAAKDYWAHNSPTGETPWTFITNAGYTYTTAGENLAYGFTNSSDTITGWMNSPGHRANILNMTYTEVGFGIINVENYQSSGNQTIVVAEYASPYASAVAPTPVAQEPASTPAPAPTPTAAPAPHTDSQPVAPRTETTTGSASGQAGGGSNQPTETEPRTPIEKPVVTQKQDTATPAASATVRGGAILKDTSASKPITRIELLTSANVAWAQFAVSMIASVSLLIFLLRHSFAWHRVLVKGEAFIVKHPVIDVAFLALAVLGWIMLQTTGFVR